MGKLITSVVNDKGTPFNVVAILPDANYGLDDCLRNESGEILIEFYDARYKHDKHGQFISRYYLKTLLEGEAGILLEGSVQEWFIDNAAMEIVRRSLVALQNGDQL